MLASPRSYSQVRKRSYWVSLNDRLTDYLPAHPPGQQRREISEDHAKLNELRSSCKIREESYKVEIEKLRLKLERIRHRFQTQHTQRQSSQEIARLKEENLLLKSQVSHQKHQLKHSSFQITSLLHTSRENSAPQPRTHPQSFLTSLPPPQRNHHQQHYHNQHPHTQHHKPIIFSSTSSSSSSRGEPTATAAAGDTHRGVNSSGYTSKILVASDVELLKLAQHKMTKENKSLKHRVDLMQGQMTEIFSIIVDERGDHKQQQTDAAAASITSTAVGGNPSLTLPQHRRRRQRVVGCSASLSTSRVEVDQLQDRIEGTKLEFLRKIKDVFEKYNKQDEVFQRNNSDLQELSRNLLNGSSRQQQQHNSRRHEKHTQGHHHHHKPHANNKKITSKYVPYGLSSSVDVVHSESTHSLSSSSEITSEDYSSQGQEEEEQQQPVVAQHSRSSSSSSSSSRSRSPPPPPLGQAQSNDQQQLETLHHPQVDDRTSSPPPPSPCIKIPPRPREKRSLHLNSDLQKLLKKDSGGGGSYVSSRSGQLQTTSIAPASFRGDSQRRANELRSIKEQYNSVLNCHQNSLLQPFYSSYNVLSSVSGYGQALHEPTPAAAAAGTTINSFTSSSRRFDHLNKFQVPKQPTSYNNYLTGSFAPTKQIVTVAPSRVASNRYRGGGGGGGDGGDSMILSLQSSPLRREEASAPAGRVDQQIGGGGSKTSRLSSVSPSHAGGSVAAAASLAGSQSERITDEYIKEIIKQYKTPRKSQQSSSSAALLSSNAMLSFNTTAAASTLSRKHQLAGSVHSHEGGGYQQMQQNVTPSVANIGASLKGGVGGVFSSAASSLTTSSAGISNSIVGNVYIPPLQMSAISSAAAYSSSVQSSVSPSRLSSIQPTRIVFQPSSSHVAGIGGGLQSARGSQAAAVAAAAAAIGGQCNLGCAAGMTRLESPGNSYSCYFSSSNNGMGSTRQGGSLYTAACTAATSGKHYCTLSPQQKKTPTIQPPPANIISSQSQMNLNHKRQSSCGSGAAAAAAAAAGSAGGSKPANIAGYQNCYSSIGCFSTSDASNSQTLNKYNLKLNLTGLSAAAAAAGTVSAKNHSSTAFQSDRQSSDRQTQARLVPQTIGRPTISVTHTSSLVSSMTSPLSSPRIPSSTRTTGMFVGPPSSRTYKR